MDERKLKEQDTELMKNEINGLNEVYREIANEIGIENITARIFLNSLRNMTTPSVQYGGSSKQVIRNERYL